LHAELTLGVIAPVGRLRSIVNKELVGCNLFQTERRFPLAAFVFLRTVPLTKMSVASKACGRMKSILFSKSPFDFKVTLLGKVASQIDAAPRRRRKRSFHAFRPNRPSKAEQRHPRNSPGCIRPASAYTPGRPA